MYSLTNLLMTDPVFWGLTLILCLPVLIVTFLICAAILLGGGLIIVSPIVAALFALVRWLTQRVLTAR